MQLESRRGLWREASVKKDFQFRTVIPVSMEKNVKLGEQGTWDKGLPLTLCIQPVRGKGKKDKREESKPMS